MYESTTLRILSAAQELLAQQGIDGLTMEATADRAGVARKTVYNYFQNKYSLIHATRLAWMESVIEQLESVSSADTLSFIEKINAIVEKGFAAIRNAGRMLDWDRLRESRASENVALPAIPDEDIESKSIEIRVRESLSLLINSIVTEASKVGYIREDFLPERVTWIFLNIIGGLLYTNIEENRFTKYDILRDSLRSVIRGILTPEGVCAMKESPIFTGEGLS